MRAEVTPDFGFYYPGQYWHSPDWIKNLVLFFDGIAMLIPEYMPDEGSFDGYPSLARVNGEQPHGIYEELFGRLLARCRTGTSRRRGRCVCRGAASCGGPGLRRLRLDQLVDIARGFPGDPPEAADQVQGSGAVLGERAQRVTSDQTIVFTSALGRKRCPHPLRRIGYRDPETPLRLPDHQLPAFREDRRTRSTGSAGR